MTTHFTMTSLAVEASQFTTRADVFPGKCNVAFLQNEVLGSTPGATLTPVHAAEVLAICLGWIRTAVSVLGHVVPHTSLGAFHLFGARLVASSWTACVYVVLPGYVVGSTHTVSAVLSKTSPAIVSLADAIETVVGYLRHVNDIS